MDKMVLYSTMNWGAGDNRDLISLVHSSTTTFYALQTLYNKYKGISSKNELDPAFNNINSYLLTDSCYLLSQKKIKIDMLAHHLTTLILTSIGKKYPHTNEVSAMLLFTSEISTIFLSAKELTLSPERKLKYGLLFALTFFIFRFPFTFYYCYKRFQYIKTIPFIGKVFCLILFTLSSIWMKQIIQITYKKVYLKR
jgi:hypothetical protein